MRYSRMGAKLMTNKRNVWLNARKLCMPGCLPTGCSWSGFVTGGADFSGQVNSICAFYD